MEKYEIAINNFINQMHYLENKHILGIILYGSYYTGYNHKDSDIDLHIITDYDQNTIYRGVNNIDNFKIEYFEKPISDIYLSIDNDFLINENAYETIIGHGKILFDRDKNIAKLKEYVLNKYSSPLPALVNDDAKEMAVIIDNRIIKLKNMLDNNRPEFISYYYLTIEKIRKFYSRICGCPNIPTDKAFKIYTDSNYRKSFCKENIPDQKFIDMYFNAISNNYNNYEKYNTINELYNYAKRNLNIDSNNYRILIKSRNNPLNKNHE